MSEFKIGTLVATRGVAGKMENNAKFRIFVQNSIDSFKDGNWGDICEEDKETNDDAVKNGERIIAVYIYPDDGTKIWIITEWDRNTTTVLFPSEY